MKRNRPLKRTGSLPRTALKKTGGTLRRTGRLNPVSNKHKERLEEYYRKRRVFLKKHPICQICKKKESSEVHHKGDGQGVKRGSNLNDERYWMALCGGPGSCHDKVESNKSWARKMGYLA